jgi:hypothetical protein
MLILFLILHSLGLSFNGVSFASVAKQIIHEGFYHFDKQILENMCPTTLRPQRVTERASYPYEANISRCELDNLVKDNSVDALDNGTISLELARSGNVLTSHPSARGISNQFMFIGGFFQWATEHGVMVVPPVFHMDGYNITNDYTVPFSFVFDREAFYRVARSRRLIVLGPVAASTTFKGKRSTIIYGLGRKCMDFEKACTRIYHAASPSSLPRIVKAIHWKVPNWDWVQIPFSKRVTDVVAPIINHLSRDDCFASLHFRVELESSDREKWAGPGANFGSLNEHIINTVKILGTYKKFEDRICSLYVASYLPNEHNAFKELQRSVPQWKIYTKFDFFPQKLETFRTMTRNMMAILEMAILERANIFLGNCRSSFSTAIAKRRNKSSSQPVEWAIPCASAKT